MFIAYVIGYRASLPPRPHSRGAGGGNYDAQRDRMNASADEMLRYADS